MQQVLRTAALWLLGSRNPAADCARLQRDRPVIAPPPPINQAGSAVIGRSFEDRILKDVMPIVAANLHVTPVGKFCRVTRHVAHCGDFAIHYRGTVGLIELKNHARALPIVDRRRFFDSLLLNYKHLDWAILVTSRCSVPRFGERGYVVVGQLLIPQDGKKMPVAFVCGLDGLGPAALEAAIRSVTDGQSPLVGPQWSALDLLERGEATKALQLQWGTGSITPFQHPAGAVF